MILVGDMLLLLIMLLCGLSGGRELPRASITGRLLLPFDAVVDRFPLTVTTEEELLDDDVVRLLPLLEPFVADCCCCCWLPLLHSEARSIRDPVNRTSLLARRHLSLSICTWTEREREKEKTTEKGLINCGQTSISS